MPWGVTRIGVKSAGSCPVRHPQRLRLGADKIYETALNVGGDQFDTNLDAHFETLSALHEPAFDNWRR